MNLPRKPFYIKKFEWFVSVTWMVENELEPVCLPWSLTVTPDGVRSAIAIQSDT